MAQWPPVRMLVVVLEGFHYIYIYIYQNDIFWVNKIFFKLLSEKLAFHVRFQTKIH